jgi:hypothetical protein
MLLAVPAQAQGPKASTVRTVPIVIDLPGLK